MATTHFPAFQRALAAGVQANVPVGVIGEPGQGKTATMESATYGWGRVVETVIGSIREATDFLGLACRPMGELADLLEVLDAPAVDGEHTLPEVVEAAAAKSAKRGTFTRCLWLEETHG